MVTDSFAASWACSHSECAFCSDDRAFCMNDGSCFCVEPGCGCTKEECYCPDDDEAWGMNGRGEWGCYNRCFDGLDAGECLKKCRCNGQPDGTDWICSKTGEWIWNYSCNAKEIIIQRKNNVQHVNNVFGMMENVIRMKVGIRRKLKKILV